MACKYSKALALLCAVAIALCACGQGPASPDASMETAPAAGLPAGSENTTGSPSKAPLPKLELVLSSFYDRGNRRDGFYMTDCPQTTMFQNLLYYDYATLQQRYLCSAPGCTHNHAGCTSYLDTWGGTYAFAAGGYLFINYALYPNGTEDRNQWPSAIERRNPDGTDPQVMITYPPCELQADMVFTDGESLFFNAPDGVVRLGIEDFEKTVIREIGDNIIDADDLAEGEYPSYTGMLSSTWQGKLLYEKGWPDGTHTLHALNVQTGEEEDLPGRWTAGKGVPYFFDAAGDSYFVDSNTGDICRYSLSTGEETVVTDAFREYNRHTVREEIGDSMDEVIEVPYSTAESWSLTQMENWLLLTIWNLDTSVPSDADWKTIAYNKDTGEASEVTFGAFYNGYEHPMNIWGMTPHGLLVIEEHRSRTIHDIGTDGAPYSFESEYWVFGLIDVEDFVHSRPNFRTLAPIAYSGA